MRSTASWAVDDAEQVALMAAQGGTTDGLGGEIGVGEASAGGVGDGVGVGVGFGLAIGDGDGLRRVAVVP